MKVNERLGEEFEKQDLGTHMCCIYRDKDEQLSALFHFVSLGIERNEKFLYIVDDRTKEEVMDAFKGLDFDVEEFMEAGQFVFMTKNESYLKDGFFDPEKMINLLKEAQKESLEEGYNGLRVTGEMTWFFSDMSGVERLMEYESKLNEFLPDSDVMALCQYNEEKFPPEILVDVFRTHPKVLIYDDLYENSYYMPPRIFTAQLKGEVAWEYYESMKETIIRQTQLRREEKKTRKQLEREKEKAQKYLDIAGVIIVVIDKNRKVIEINQRGFEILGYEKEEIIGKDWYENFLPERVKEGVIEESQKPLIEGRIEEAERYENPVLTKDGEERIISWRNSVVTNDKDEIIGTLSSGMDITEKKKLEKELREAEQEKALILESSPNLIVHQNLDHEIIWANKRAGESVDEDPLDLVGRKCYEIWHDRKESCENCPVEKSWETGEVERGEVESSDGRFWLITGAPIRNEEGDIIGAVEITLDITERKKAEERKEFLNTLLRQDLVSKYQVIQGYLQLLEGIDLPEEYREYLRETVRTAAEAGEILGLAKELREVEKTGWMAEKDILKVFDHVMDDVSDVVDETGVEVEERFPDKIEKVEGDYSLKILFSQILKTRIQTTECDKIKISAEEKDGRILVKIEDNGGELPQEIKNLFSGKPYTGETAGAGGVRYYMIRQLVENNNGKIEVRDSDIGGAEFNVHLQKA